MAPAIARHGAGSVKQILRELQNQWRAARSAPAWSGDAAAWAEAVAHALDHSGYRPLFNLTGTVIHTNLGRALPSRALFDAVADLVTRPMNLEFDIASGRRGDREAPVTRRLRLLTGAAAATVVNNGAAALMLVLNTLARDRTVPVSRGELIEIGGSFRLPDIMERAGCRLLEVGTTNRTHPEDFAATADRAPALLLKVHPSNFSIQGFTRETSTRELAGVAADLGVPLCVDLGSGSLVDLTRWNLPAEPTPAQVLAQGAACNHNPMKRALRADKITLALLEQLLALYDTPDRLPETLPLLHTLTLPADVLTERGERVAATLAPRLPGACIEVVASECQIGSGALPDRPLPSIAVRITPASGTDAEALHAEFRRLPVPVVGRVSRGALWLDMRGAEPLEALLASLAAAEPAP